MKMAFILLSFLFGPQAWAVGSYTGPCEEKRAALEGEKDKFSKCVDQVSHPVQKSEPRKEKEAPCTHEFETLIQAALDLRVCLETSHW